MNEIKTYKALAIVSRVDQGELIKRLIKENKILTTKDLKRKKFYKLIKCELLQLKEYHHQMVCVTDYYSDEEEEDGYDNRLHTSSLETILSILIEEYDDLYHS